MWTDFESFLKTDSVQQVKQVNKIPDISSVFCFFPSIQEKNKVVKELVLPYFVEYQCSWTSDIGTALSEENSLKKLKWKPTVLSVVQVSDN